MLSHCLIASVLCLIVACLTWGPCEAVFADERGGIVAIRSRRQTTDLTATEHQAYVDKHNALRSQVMPSASNMEHMVYDSSLAATALEWSQKCDFRHSLDHPTLSITLTGAYGTDYGENLAVTTSATQPDVTDIIQSWYDEVTDYTYATNQCVAGKACGHYTQIVWAQSVRVGCGVHHCPNGVTLSDPPSVTYVFNGAAAWMVTCHYTPAGNYNSIKPYISGPICSRCESGIGYCLNNNCIQLSNCAGADQCVCKAQCFNCGTVNRAECRCQCPTGWLDADCSTACQDTDSQCTTVAAFPMLNCPTPGVADLCPVACSRCSPPGSHACANPNIPNTYEGGSDDTPTSMPGPDTGGDMTTEDTDDDGTDSEDETESPQTERPSTVRVTVTSSTPSVTVAPSTCRLVCVNAGVLNPTACTCQCSSAFRGDRCQYEATEVLFTLKFRIRHVISRFNVIRNALLSGITSALNTYCAKSVNYKQCCPQLLGLSPTTSSVQAFIGQSAVQVASGYPEPVTSAVYVVGIIVEQGQSPLCQALQNPSKKRRSTSEVSEGRRNKRQTSGQLLDVDLLYAAVDESLADLKQRIINVGDGGELLSVTRDETPDTTPGPGGLSTIVIAVIVSAIVLTILLICVCFIVCFVVTRKKDGPAPVRRRQGTSDRVNRVYDPSYDPRYDSHYDSRNNSRYDPRYDSRNNSGYDSRYDQVYDRPHSGQPNNRPAGRSQYDLVALPENSVHSSSPDGYYMYARH